MDFTLYYRGPLRANRGPSDKHEIRRHFHVQLRNLWGQIPLSGYSQFLRPEVPDGELSVIEHRHGFRFAPLVSSRIKFAASLDILLLRPEPPGTILSQSGDIDNRIKTLLDALKVPHEATALPKNCVPGSDEDPFFCLLQDDSLITGLAVRTDRLLDPVRDPSEVVLLVKVRAAPVQSLIATLGL
jgi:hypothetical protein